jgi:hypothetical protein
MDRISTPRDPTAPARSWPHLDIAGETGRLGPDRVFVQRTPIGYVCAGLGDPARLLRLAFEEPREAGAARNRENYETNPIFAAACRRLDRAVEIGGAAKARRLGLDIPLGAIDDPALRRLAIAAALIKAGFDPGQARDQDGRWTSGGGGDASAGDVTVNTSAPVAVAPAAGVVAAGATAALGETAEAGAGWSLWSKDLLALLPRIPLIPGALGLAGGLVLFLVPSNHGGSLESSGTLPDNPDIAFHRSEGRLQLFHLGPDGTRTTLYDGYPGDDNFYRDSDGHVIARDLGYEKGFVLDPSAVSTLSPPTMDAKAKEKDPAEEAGRNATLAGAKAVVRAIDQTQVCPDPTFDWPHGASTPARLYQQQVTMLPWGVAFDIGGTKFDGCRYWGDGTMLEAKGKGYAWALTENGWLSGYRGGPRMEAQMADQSAKAWAVGKRVEWHFAEKSVADYFKIYAKRFPNVDVEWEAPLRKPANRKLYMWEPGEVLFASAGEFMRFDLFRHLKMVPVSFLPNQI